MKDWSDVILQGQGPEFDLATAKSLSTIGRALDATNTFCWTPKSSEGPIYDPHAQPDSHIQPDSEMPPGFPQNKEIKSREL